jgi:hypothetical protein
MVVSFTLASTGSGPVTALLVVGLSHNAGRWSVRAQGFDTPCLVGVPGESNERGGQLDLTIGVMARFGSGPVSSQPLGCDRDGGDPSEAGGGLDGGEIGVAGFVLGDDRLVGGDDA